MTRLIRSFLAMTTEEVELFKENPLQFYLYQKDASNEVKGNELRGKARELIASIGFKYEHLN